MTIFNFDDSRPYLRHFIAHLPRKGRGELTRIAEELRVSTTLISQILAEKKSFTSEQAQTVIVYLGLTGIEADYFLFLIQKERAGSKALRDHWSAKLNELRTHALQVVNRVKTDRTLSEEERTKFYSSPIYSAMRLYTSVGEKGKSLAEVAERFELPRAQVAEMLKFLVETGLCNEHDDRFTLGAQKTHIEQKSPHFLRHHSNWRLRAIRRCEELSQKELMYTAPVSLSEKDFDWLRDEMVDFIKKFLDRVHASPAEEIACFNLDFFWIQK